MNTRKEETVTLTEDEFIARFQPEMDADGYIQYGWTRPADVARVRAADAERRTWTMVDTDSGDLALVDHCARVNREYYVICAVPRPPNTSFDVVFDPIPRCLECDVIVDGPDAPYSHCWNCNAPLPTSELAHART